MGTLSDSTLSRLLKKLNQINAFWMRSAAYLSDVSKSVWNVCVCISQVLTAYFSPHREPKARRYWIASPICAALGMGAPARSAMLRATFRTR